jgi:murein DD-endopeptidase MepM/ murein hydrolase activator NlpD
MPDSDDQLALKDLSYGFMNPVADGRTGNSTDLRRTDTMSRLGAFIGTEYARHALKGVEEFRGIVVQVAEKTGIAADPREAVLEEYAKRNWAQRAAAAATSVLEGPNRPVYKVYIPELECRPAPTSFGDPIITTYYNVYLDDSVTGIFKSEPKLGSLVTVKFGNVANFSDPRIIRIGEQIAFHGVNPTGNQSAHRSNSSRPASGTPGSSPPPAAGTDMRCPSTSTVNGSDQQTGTQLHQDDWTAADWPSNPVSNWVLPIKPSEGFEGHPTRLRASGGWYRVSGGAHYAIDLSARTGTPLYAVQDGQVVASPTSLCRSHGPSTAGNQIQYKTVEGYYVLYIHMDMPSHLRAGDMVRKGQLVGYVGNTGHTDPIGRAGEHLHWAVGTQQITQNTPSSAKLNAADFYPADWIWINDGATNPPAQTHYRRGSPQHTPRRV